jgi:hypothetical protein
MLWSKLNSVLIWYEMTHYCLFLTLIFKFGMKVYESCGTAPSRQIEQTHVWHLFTD